MENIVKIPASEWHKLKKAIEKISAQSEQSNLVSEEEAAKILGLKLITIRNKVSKKEMEGMYTVGAAGKRFYYRSRITGLEKL